MFSVDPSVLVVGCSTQDMKIFNQPELLSREQICCGTKMSSRDKICCVTKQIDHVTSKCVRCQILHSHVRGQPLNLYALLGIFCVCVELHKC